jgi:hypothetical protein
MSLLPGSAIPLSGYDIYNSLRFRASATAYLNRTPTVAGNRQKFTWSAWVKRGTLSSGFPTLYMGGNTQTDATFCINFNPTDNLTIRGYTSVFLSTTQVFRDPSAWYHIVVAVDTTQATSSNRVKLYVNGVEVTAGTRSDPALNFNFLVNTAVAHFIGYQSAVWGFNYFDGYLAELNFIDGQQLTPSSFGSTNATTGVWQPAGYTGTYGTNGFYQNYSSIALTSGSNTGLGRDFSGNGNYWNTNNISVTAGVTYDAMSDVPTLTSATVANYAVLNPLVYDGGIADTYSQANLSVVLGNASNGRLTWSTMSMSSGKWYVEFIIVTASLNAQYFGLIPIANAWTNRNTGNTNVGANSGEYAYGRVTATYATGTTFINGTITNLGTTLPAVGDVIGLAFDATAGTMACYLQNVLQTTITGIPAGEYFFALSAASYQSTVNFGQRPFAYTPPTGFVRLNTFNLPDSTIVKGNTVMDATTYTGNASTQTITNAAGFKPDFVWTKSRANAYQHNLYNSISGINKFLQSNNTGAETTLVGSLTSFNSNGYTLGTQDNSNFTNGSAAVGWQWQAGQGSTSSNTSGTVTSTVSVNATAGFSVVTWAAQSTARTVGHSLGVAPSMIIMKDRSGAIQWFVYHASIGAGKYLTLNTTAALVTNATVFSTAPTSSVFDPGTGFTTGNGYGNQVAYCWAEIAGFSKFGIYTGNGSADGPFVYTGFRPKFIMFKNASAVGQWLIKDTSRNPSNIADANLYPNLANAEDVVATAYIDILSNGFKLRGTYADINGSTNGIVYAAFAENPFKNALAR